MDEKLKRIKELFSESEKRNGELSHENFELKKRIAELGEIEIVHCSECIWLDEDYTKCKIGNINGGNKAYFCADGERIDDDEYYRGY